MPAETETRESQWTRGTLGSNESQGYLDHWMRFYLKRQEVNNQKTFFLKKSFCNLMLVSGEFKYKALGNVLEDRTWQFPLQKFIGNGNLALSSIIHTDLYNEIKIRESHVWAACCNPIAWELEAERSRVQWQPSYSNGRYSFSKTEKPKNQLVCCWLSAGWWLQGAGRSSRTETHAEAWVRDAWAVVHCQKQFMQTSDFSQLREEGKCHTVLSLAVHFS